MHVRGHLVIAAAARMKLAAYRSDFVDQRLFDIHVDVFVTDGEFLLSAFNPIGDQMKAVRNFLHIRQRQNPAFAQHGHMGQAALNILLRQLLVEGNGSCIFLHQLIRLFGKASAPQF
ncbi:hypothetical protein D3C81_1857850 [compost metagenome]